ncbi:Protein kinase, putative [Hondaea fermentalgiana]|uniref:Protein kinase, putative n=1 Tax=Hondaea fermentalgiana TaxID=2315210 RepID=A0A2R5GMU2_9STRA|nr:Protein kinase, putative [Hondaea fermentalgiana]|eukprot:GBG29184.1 Protein kinase, putative [Hondaea fermentalgiana]
MGPSLQTQITTSNEVTADEDGNVIKVNGYKLGAVIGTGSFGVVVRARHETGMFCAIKIIDRKRLKRAQFGPRTSNASRTDLKREIAIQKRLRHPNILPLIEVIDDPSHPKTYMVTSFVDGGALMPDHSKASPLQECRARRLMVQLVSAVDYLHKHNIIHKDIKPSNLLVDKTDRLLLSDFGAAQAFRDDEDPMINRTDGTMAFLAPEMCSGEAFNGKLTDIWAVGATLFMMIFGTPPFVADTAQALIDLIQEGDVNYPPRPGSAGVTTRESDHDVVGLLKSILEKDLSKRASFAQISAHPWSTDYGRVEFLLPEVEGPIEVSEKEIATAISAYKVNSVRTLGSPNVAGSAAAPGQ